MAKFLPSQSEKWGRVFLERLQILSGIQFSRLFIEFVFVVLKKAIRW